MGDARSFPGFGTAGHKTCTSNALFPVELRTDYQRKQIQSTLNMITFLLWCLLFLLCWPLALLALVLYPFVWLLLCPFESSALQWEARLTW